MRGRWRTHRRAEWLTWRMLAGLFLGRLRLGCLRVGRGPRFLSFNKVKVRNKVEGSGGMSAPHGLRWLHPANSRFLHCAVAVAPAPVGMTKSKGVAVAP